jgi:uncharacterized OB-fold protein
MYQRTLDERYLLEASRCAACFSLVFPRKGTCPGCGALKGFQPVRLGGTGTVYAVTQLAGGGAPPEFLRQAEVKGGYVVAIIQMDEGPRVVAQVADASEMPAIGTRVRAVLRRIYEEEGVVRYGYKFKADTV